MKSNTLSRFSVDERDYWHYKELYWKLPLEYQNKVNNKRKDVLFKDVIKKFLKTLPKLEQLIYTNEIQGE